MDIDLLRKISTLTILLAFLLSISSCIEREEPIEKTKEKVSEGKGVRSISSLLNEKDLYKGKTVIISGKVSTGLAFEFVDEQPYIIDDETGQIWVITTGTMPEEGKWITVKGKVVMPYQIKGRSYEIAIMEIERW